MRVSEKRKKRRIDTSSPAPADLSISLPVFQRDNSRPQPPPARLGQPPDLAQRPQGNAGVANAPRPPAQSGVAGAGAAPSPAASGPRQPQVRKVRREPPTAPTILPPGRAVVALLPADQSTDGKKEWILAKVLRYLPGDKPRHVARLLIGSMLTALRAGMRFKTLKQTTGLQVKADCKSVAI